MLRRFALGVGLGSASLVCGRVTSASAQQAVDGAYASAPQQSGGTLSLWSGQTYAPGRFALALGLEARPVRVAQGSADTPGTGSSFELFGSIGIWSRLDLSAAIALDRITFQADGDEAAQSRAGLGDVRLVPRLGLWDDGQGSGLALVMATWLPAGGGPYAAPEGFRVEPRVAFTLAAGALQLTANTGYHTHLEEERLGVRSSNFVTAGIGGQYSVASAWSVLGEVAGRWAPHDRAVTHDSGLAADALVGVRFASQGWGAQFAGGTGLSGAELEPSWRLLAGVSFSPGAAVAQPAASEPEAPVVEELRYPNTTADWRPPEAVESPPGAEEEANAESPAASTEVAAALAVGPDPTPSGSPAPASSPLAKQPAAEPPPSSASPAPVASDMEALAAELDAVERGDVSSASDPVEAFEPDTAELPSIDEIIYFDSNQMRLTEEQLAIVEQVAQRFAAMPEDAQLVVEGHSDSAGPSDFNWRLSRMRASTVRFYLMRTGIAWQRIAIRGYGSSRPAPIDEAPRPGRHRRVEFRVVPGAR